MICRDVQRDIVRDLPTHVDFLRLRRTTKINLFVQIEFQGEEECAALRKGGVLTIVRPEIELVVTAGDIPENIVVDLTKLENIGDTMTISMVDLPVGAKPTIDRDFVICNISAPSALKSQEDEDEDEAKAKQQAEAAETRRRKRPDPRPCTGKLPRRGPAWGRVLRFQSSGL